jgi:hypothetical protein
MRRPYFQPIWSITHRISGLSTSTAVPNSCEELPADEREAYLKHRKSSLAAAVEDEAED